MAGASPQPLIITPGEPAGIAPEIIALAWQALRHNAAQSFCLIGDADAFAARVKMDIFKPVARIADANAIFANSIPVLHRPLPVVSHAGQLDARNSPWVIAAIDEAVGLCMGGQATGMVTGPIQKNALYDVGFTHQGHTDYIAALARLAGHNVTEVMMLVAGGLRTVPITVHIPLAAVPQALTTPIIVAQGKIVAAALKKHFGISSPRIAVTGLNPHAGENGAMGHEDQTIIVPAIAELRAAGISVQGPLPADTAFHVEARAQYDAILCMYHDQALIPVKTLDFHGGVNVTLGLPFIRTSPDHGTALNLAGTGKANPASLIAAIKLASAMARA